MMCGKFGWRKQRPKSFILGFTTLGFITAIPLVLWLWSIGPFFGKPWRAWLGKAHPDLLAIILDHSLSQVPAGWFTMGSEAGRPDESPERQVWLDAYSLDRFEVTNAQYARFILESASPTPPYWVNGRFPPDLADVAVVGVSWQTAKDYCAWAGKRLPTEAEWEKACRGGDARYYPWGIDWRPDLLNAQETGVAAESDYIEAQWERLEKAPAQGAAGLRPVGSFPDGASPYGVHDLAGNASEWVQDWYNPGAYRQLPARQPLSAGPPWNHVLRGSSWWVHPLDAAMGSSLAGAFESRCMRRNSSHSADDPRVGFRCAKSGPS